MMETGDESHVVRCGTVMSSLKAALTATSSLSADSMNKLHANLNIYFSNHFVDQKSLIANTNLLEFPEHKSRPNGLASVQRPSEEESRERSNA